MIKFITLSGKIVTIWDQFWLWFWNQSTMKILGNGKKSKYATKVVSFVRSFRKTILHPVSSTFKNYLQLWSKIVTILDQIRFWFWNQSTMKILGNVKMSKYAQIEASFLRNLQLCGLHPFSPASFSNIPLRTIVFITGFGWTQKHWIYRLSPKKIIFENMQTWKLYNSPLNKLTT